MSPTNVEICSNCGRLLLSSEQAYVFRGKIVCAECDRVLLSEQVPQPAPSSPKACLASESSHGNAALSKSESSAKTSKLAIWSFVLGILTFFLGVITVIPALICGIVGLVKVNKSKGQLKGASLAIAGITISLCAMAITAFISILVSKEDFLTNRFFCRREEGGKYKVSVKVKDMTTPSVGVAMVYFRVTVLGPADEGLKAILIKPDGRYDESPVDIVNGSATETFIFYGSDRRYFSFSDVTKRSKCKLIVKTTKGGIWGIFGGTVYYQKTIELVSRRGEVSIANPD